MQAWWLGMERMLRADPSAALSLYPLSRGKNEEKCKWDKGSGSGKMFFLQESSLSSGSCPPSLTKASPTSQITLCVRGSVFPLNAV